MGLHLPGASFVNPNTPLRDALTMLGVRKRALEITALGNQFTPIGRVIDERRVVNGVVGLHATGGSTSSPFTWWRWPQPPASRSDGGFRRPRGSDAAFDPDLPQREGRRGPFPRCGRHGPPDPGTSWSGAGAWRRAERLGRTRRLYAVQPRLDAEGAVAWSPAARRVGRSQRLARGARAVSAQWRLARAGRIARQGGHHTLAVAPDRHTIEAPAECFTASGIARCVPERRTQPGLRRRCSDFKDRRPSACRNCTS